MTFAVFLCYTLLTLLVFNSSSIHSSNESFISSESKELWFLSSFGFACCFASLIRKEVGAEEEQRLSQSFALRWCTGSVCQIFYVWVQGLAATESLALGRATHDATRRCRSSCRVDGSKRNRMLAPLDLVFAILEY